MKFLGLTKVSEGKYLTKYDLTYETSKKNIKNYEMVSRNRDLHSVEELYNGKADSVVMIMTDPAGERLLLTREFRMALGRTVYGFPAGLVDPGESCEESARRELWEETGLTLKTIEKILPDSFNCVGITNEKSCVIIGTAEGEFTESTSDEEEIECRWYSREEVRHLVATEAFSARVQMFCYFWSQSNL
ncbi:MAG: NUDIX hydrolase [Clostridia bacterium]|nr:NUDIX hydrolase [Clostridia bacterium]